MPPDKVASRVPPVIVNEPSPLTPLAPSPDMANFKVPPDIVPVTVSLSIASPTDFSPASVTSSVPPVIVAFVFFLARNTPFCLYLSDVPTIFNVPSVCV